MTRRLLWLFIPLSLGLVIAVMVIAMPAQAAKSQLTSTIPYDDLPPGGQVFGLVNSFPNGLVGSWTVDNVVYTATTQTHFDMEEGPFYVGACVRVIYSLSNHNALEIETQEHEKCGEQANLYLIGLINQAPPNFPDKVSGSSGITATWVISGIQFVSTPETDFETEHGPLVVGACAEVKYRTVNGVNLAHEISSESMYRCLGPVAFNQAFGHLVTFPANLLGTWVISNTTGMSLTFMSTPSTILHIYGTPLQVGACVGVKYYSNGGVNYALSIWVGASSLCDGHFGGGQPISKIIATVDIRPAGVVTGTWTLAGVAFTATEQTRFEEEDNHLVVGSCAEAKYDPTNGAMLLKTLEGEEAEDCQTESGAARFKLFGLIEVMPTSGFTGTWQVSGVTLQATPTTTLESRHGDFAIGAYVKVYFTYDPATGVRTAQTIKTHVAPGFGWRNFHGHFDGWILDPRGDKLIVDGQTYNADPGIDAPAGLKKGDQVWVNLYQDSGATFVTQVVLAQQAYLPIFRR